jgi:hypothetical protein
MISFLTISISRVLGTSLPLADQRLGLCTCSLLLIILVSLFSFLSTKESHLYRYSRIIIIIIIISGVSFSFPGEIATARRGLELLPFPGERDTVYKDRSFLDSVYSSPQAPLLHSTVQPGRMNLSLDFLILTTFLTADDAGDHH